ncbi:MAG: universal stress protein [Usitatibacteraceae bacterium]
MKALVAIDGSECALRALRYVVEHLEMLGTDPELVLVNVHPPVPSARAKAVLGSDVIDQYYKDEAEEALAPARALLMGKPCRVTERAVVGQPAAQIIATAMQDVCGLIVVGTQGRSALGNFFVGSVAGRVIAESSIPVLSVK